MSADCANLYVFHIPYDAGFSDGWWYLLAKINNYHKI